MKTLLATLLAVAALLFAAEGAPPKPKTPTPKPGPSVRDLAIAEARKADENHDGRISGTEVTVLREMWTANPKSWLYLFDDNGNKRLDDEEIEAIKFKPSPKPSTPSPFTTTPKPGAPSVFKTTPKPATPDITKPTPAKKDKK